MKGWDLKYIQQLKDNGKIQDYRIIGTKKPQDQHRIATKKPNKTKEWIALNLAAWCKANRLELIPEYRFCEERKWRFDWCVPHIKIAIEYNGLMSQKSRHTTIKGYSGDMEKINAAQQLGWVVLQYTVVNYKNMLSDLGKIKV